MNVSELIQPENVVTGFPAADKETTLKAMVSALIERGLVPEKSRRTVVTGILDREAVGTTGIGNGIAIPHFKTKTVDEPVIAFFQLEEPIDYEATDGGPVRNLFLVLSPLAEADRHVKVLRWIAKLARSRRHARILANETRADSIHELFQEIDDDA